MAVVRGSGYLPKGRRLSTTTPMEATSRASPAMTRLRLYLSNRVRPSRAVSQGIPRCLFPRGWWSPLRIEVCGTLGGEGREGDGRCYAAGGMEQLVKRCLGDGIVRSSCASAGSDAGFLQRIPRKGCWFPFSRNWRCPGRSSDRSTPVPRWPSGGGAVSFAPGRE